MLNEDYTVPAENGTRDNAIHTCERYHDNVKMQTDTDQASPGHLDMNKKTIMLMNEIGEMWCSECTQSTTVHLGDQSDDPPLLVRVNVRVFWRLVNRSD